MTSKQEQGKKERRFSQEQYNMLLRCSEKGDKGIAEWNQWRKENPKEKILLELADLQGRYLYNVDLADAILWDAHLEDAKLGGANLKSANLNWANVKRGELVGTRLERASLIYTDLEGANLSEAHLENTIMHWACLEGAEFIGTHLQGSRLHNATVNGSTLVQECEVDRYTDFRGVGLDSARIDAGTKQLLEYNIRRKNWEEWYPQQHWPLRWLVRKFWQISDYGISTRQIIKTFFQWALIFAAIYLAWGLIDYHLVGLKDDPGIVSNLFVLEGEQETVSPWLVPFRSVYFSIVTMTTLGFGDMYASAHSFLRGLFGHTLLGLQVILGYVLLGALITRFAVLFTAGGPAGKFAKQKKKVDSATSAE